MPWKVWKVAFNESQIGNVQKLKFFPLLQSNTFLVDFDYEETVQGLHF